MGILNITPDSFSDGGLHFDLESAIAQGVEMFSKGADIVDVGGESTRPGAENISAEEEIRRVLPAIKALKSYGLLSIDTRKQIVAEAAVAAGAVWVNDVSGFRFDPAMFDWICFLRQPYVLVHSIKEPTTMQLDLTHHYPEGVVPEVRRFFWENIEGLKKKNYPLEKLVLDPGIGFGKSSDHNLELLRGLSAMMEEFRPLGVRFMIGASRKSFLGKITGKSVEERLSGSLAVASYAALRGVDLLRVHDVTETVDVCRVVQAIKN